MNKTSKALLRLIVYLSLPFIHCAVWIFLIEPSPDKDGIFQLYYPLLNFLKGSHAVGLDYFTLSKEFFNDAYPDGPALLAWLICLLNCDSLFLNEPYFVIIFLLLPFVVIMWGIPLKKRIFLLVLSLFFLPATQICLKGFSPHAFNVFYTFAGILSFTIYYRNNSFRWLFLAAFLFWISMIFKHMGIVHFISFLMAYSIWQILETNRPFRENLVLFITPLMALPLYPWNQSSQYLKTSLSHAPFIQSENLIIVPIMVVFCLVSGILFLKKIRLKSSTKSECRWFKSSAPFLIFICLSFWMWFEPLSEQKSMRNAFITLLVGYTTCIYFLVKYRVSGIRSLLILITLLTITHNLSAYVSWIAKSSYLFFLPQFLLLFLWSAHKPRFGKLSIVLLALFFLTNFFPGLSLLEQNLRLSKFSSIYFEGFKSIHQNPLGWNKSNIRKMRSNLEQTFKLEGLKGKSIYINQALHFHSRNALLFPRNIIHHVGSITALDDLDQEAAIAIRKLWLKKRSVLFSNWSKSGKISLIIMGKDPFTIRKNEIFSINELIENNTFQSNQFLQAISRAYSLHLVTSETLTKFYRPLIIEQLPSLSFWFHRSIEPSGESQSAYDIWESELTGKLSNATKQAARLFLESNRYYDSDPEKCLQLLEEANRLDPTNLEVKKDLRELIQRLENKSSSELLK